MVEPLSLLPLSRFKAKRLLAVGDPLQLPPTLNAVPPRLGVEAKKQGQPAQAPPLEQTLFVRLAQGGTPTTMLRTQYRCHPRISAVANALFYSGRLVDGTTEETRAPVLLRLPPVSVVDVVRAGGERAVPPSPSCCR